MKFSAVIVTRGNVDLGPAIAPIVPLADEIIIRRGHNGVFERWSAIFEAKHSLVYTQDDDAVVDLEAFAGYGLNGITCNMPEWKRAEYQDGTALVGWGAWVPKAVAFDAFVRYRQYYEPDELFRRECDRVITGLSKLFLADVPFTNLPWATGPGRMCAAPGDRAHAEARKAIRERLEHIRNERRPA